MNSRATIPQYLWYCALPYGLLVMRKIGLVTFAVLFALAIAPAQAYTLLPDGKKVYRYPNGSAQARQLCVRVGMAKGYDAAKAISWCAVNNDGRY